ncbi:hypothetical protein POM88_015612 [Heracleum sosnowskyi]|uniref:Replication factor A C-terminal domain-containing protein n=1 Tax=Heracleum sosnowskyi TaxID=360622 RepID=A0AAD8ILZ7_9APIA|nr:hypothetical protein POM88_015612 [Heracleum sosnowskyi]
MSFNKYDTVEDLNDSKHDWLLRVRAQAIWKGITKETKDFRGYNVIFIDDCKMVECKVTVKKFDKKVKWYSNFCAKCDINIELVDRKYQCGQCRKIFPYPDKRYQLTSLCSDNTGTVPIIWTDEEVIRLCGKTVYDIIADDEEVEDGDKFPTALQELEKKEYNITIIVTKENVKEGSKVYTATKIAAPNEMCGNHSPSQKENSEVKATEISNFNMSSPPHWQFYY